MSEKEEPQRRGISIEDRERIKQLSLMDDEFMNLCLEDNIPCIEKMLRIILAKEDLAVKTARTQFWLQGFSRSIRLDIHAEDSLGALHNIEMQNANKGADPKRARFHGAMIDAHALKASQDFNELPDWTGQVRVRDGRPVIPHKGAKTG